MTRSWKGFTAAAVVVVITLVAAHASAPSIEDVPCSQAVYDAHGHLLRLTLSRDGTYRLWAPLSGISQTMATATRLYEDRLFYKHPGINPLSLARAVFDTYVRRVRRVGGSTLTMQLARLRSGDRSDTVQGKARQIVRALGLELRYSKPTLLQAYLNVAPYGHNIEGVGAASLIYFGKDASRLNLSEASLLACMPQNPVARAPGGDDAALAACAQRLFTRVCADTPALCESLPFNKPARIGARGALPFAAPHFVDGALQRHPDEPRLRTTLDLRQQRLLERILHNSVDSMTPSGVRNGAAMLVDARDMSVHAVVGSRAFFDAGIMGQVDGTRALRSPGSTLKPFIYAQAIDQGLIHPATMLKDAPRRFGLFNPENFDGGYLGPVSAREALWRSRNLPAVELLSHLHTPDLYDTLQAAGVPRLGPREHYGLALALGGVEVTMENLVTLYAALANDGLQRPLRFTQSDVRTPGSRLFSAEAAFMVREMLATARRPDQAFPANWLPSTQHIAWKTGTSYAFRDAWAVGIAGPWVLAVWMGNFDGAGNPALLAREAAAPAFFRVIDALRAAGDLQSTVAERPTPEHLTRVNVCARSGQIPGPHCKHTVPTWFIPGVSPLAPCALHRTDGNEAWGSDMRRLFAEQGLPRRAQHAPVASSTVPAGGDPPVIVSPQVDTTYHVRVTDASHNTLPLIAQTDAHSNRVHWFLDDAYLGEAAAGDALFWPLKQGAHILLAVDEQGRATAQRLNVRAER